MRSDSYGESETDRSYRYGARSRIHTSHKSSETSKHFHYSPREYKSEFHGELMAKESALEAIASSARSPTTSAFPICDFERDSITYVQKSICSSKRLSFVM